MPRATIALFHKKVEAGEPWLHSGQGRKRLRRDEGIFPAFDGLRPKIFKEPMKGKYGDPSDKQL